LLLSLKQQKFFTHIKCAAIFTTAKKLEKVYDYMKHACILGIVQLKIFEQKWFLSLDSKGFSNRPCSPYLDPMMIKITVIVIIIIT